MRYHKEHLIEKFKKLSQPGKVMITRCGTVRYSPEADIEILSDSGIQRYIPVK